MNDWGVLMVRRLVVCTYMQVQWTTNSKLIALYCESVPSIGHKVELSNGQRGSSEVKYKCGSPFAELYCLVQAVVVQYLCWADNDRVSNVHFVFLRILLWKNLSRYFGIRITSCLC